MTCALCGRPTSLQPCSVCLAQLCLDVGKLRSDLASARRWAVVAMALGAASAALSTAHLLARWF